MEKSQWRAAIQSLYFSGTYLQIKKILLNIGIMPNGHSGNTRVQKETWAKY